MFTSFRLQAHVASSYAFPLRLGSGLLSIRKGEPDRIPHNKDRNGWLLRHQSIPHHFWPDDDRLQGFDTLSPDPLILGNISSPSTSSSVKGLAPSAGCCVATGAESRQVVGGSIGADLVVRWRFAGCGMITEARSLPWGFEATPASSTGNSITDGVKGNGETDPGDETYFQAL